MHSERSLEHLVNITISRLTCRWQKAKSINRLWISFKTLPHGLAGATWTNATAFHGWLSVE